MVTNWYRYITIEPWSGGLYVPYVFWSSFFGSIGCTDFGCFWQTSLCTNFGQQFFSGPRYVVNSYCLLSENLKQTYSRHASYRGFLLTFRPGQLLYIQPWVNFINILHKHFLYESKLSSFSLVILGFVIFWCQNIGKKVARKMLMKLGQFHQHFLRAFFLQTSFF